MRKKQINQKIKVNISNKEPEVHVYVAKKHDVLSFGGLFPIKRQNEIDEVSNLEVKKDKYLVWKLLEYALKQSFGVDIKDVKFTKDATGKWLCDKCEFSLSHSKNVVCVAVSKNPIGVDVEKINSDRFEFLEKILSDKEKEEYQKIKPEEKAEFLFNAWTKKESLFKRKNLKEISIKEFSLLDEKVYQEKLDFSDGEYSLSVATELISKINTYVIEKYSITN